MSPPIPSLWSFVAQASPIVKLVLIILLGCSILSWTIILQRSYTLRRIRRSSYKFLQHFWSGIDLRNWLDGWQRAPNHECCNANMIASGLQEMHKLEPITHLNSEQRLTAIERSMQIDKEQTISRLEQPLNILASIGSTSPYMGLFGTVWGIMTSFRALGQASQATLAMVAPGIAEALIATAVGLFAAIPAVLAYNRFSARIAELDDQYQQLMQSFLGLLYRQLESQHQSINPAAQVNEKQSSASQHATNAVS